MAFVERLYCIVEYDSVSGFRASEQTLWLSLFTCICSKTTFLIDVAHFISPGIIFVSWHMARLAVERHIPCWEAIRMRIIT